MNKVIVHGHFLFSNGMNCFLINVMNLSENAVGVDRE
jgi:hypothetical protein